MDYTQRVNLMGQVAATVAALDALSAEDFNALVAGDNDGGDLWVERFGNLSVRAQVAVERTLKAGRQLGY